MIQPDLKVLIQQKTVEWRKMRLVEANSNICMRLCLVMLVISEAFTVFFVLLLTVFNGCKLYISYRHMKTQCMTWSEKTNGMKKKQGNIYIWWDTSISHSLSSHSQVNVWVHHQNKICPCHNILRHLAIACGISSLLLNSRDKPKQDTCLRLNRPSNIWIIHFWCKLQCFPVFQQSDCAMSVTWKVCQGGWLALCAGLY